VASTTANDRRDDADECRQDVPVDQEHVRTDEIQRPSGVARRQAGRLAEALQYRLLGGRPLLASGEAIFQ